MNYRATIFEPRYIKWVSLQNASKIQDQWFSREWNLWDSCGCFSVTGCYIIFNIPWQFPTHNGSFTIPIPLSSSHLSAWREEERKGRRKERKWWSPLFYFGIFKYLRFCPILFILNFTNRILFTDMSYCANYLRSCSVFLPFGIIEWKVTWD